MKEHIEAETMRINRKYVVLYIYLCMLANVLGLLTYTFLCLLDGEGHFKG
jgi:hypothetical protein